MKNIFTLLLCISLSLLASGQKKVLIFSKTARYHHESIDAGIKAIKKLGLVNHFSVDQTIDSCALNENNLKQYAAIIFLSPSGNIIDSAGKQAMQKFIRSGKGFVGIHAASTIEKNWSWYGKLVGGVFTGHPEPQTATLRVEDSSHPATKFFPPSFSRRDEWYNFRDLQRGLHVLLRVDEKSYKGGENGAYHPIAWYHEFEGGRSFYTALGHFPEHYEDPLFLKHLLAGIQYALQD